MPPNLYGYRRPEPPPVEEDEAEEETPDESPPMRGLFVAGEIKNLSLEADTERLESSIRELGIALANVEMAIEALPKRIAEADEPDAPLDLSPVTDAIERLSDMMEKNHSEREDEAAVTQTVKRDASGRVISITTRKGKGPARTRTVIRGADGYITGTVEK